MKSKKQDKKNINYKNYFLISLGGFFIWLIIFLIVYLSFK